MANRKVAKETKPSTPARKSISAGRKQAKNVLRESEVILTESQFMAQQLIEALPNPVFFKGIDGRYLGVNKAWEAYFYTPRDAFVGKTVFDLYPGDPEIARRLHTDDQTLWDHPGTSVYETNITTPDGKKHDAIYYKATFTNRAGAIAGLICTVIDITERKELEQRYRDTFELAPVGIARTTLDGKYLQVNQKFAEMLRCSKEELFALSPQDFIHPDERVSIQQERANLLSGVSNNIRGQRRFVRKDGRVIWANRTLSLARDPAGQPLYIIGVIEDITENKEKEERYQAMFENAAVGITRVDLNGILVDVNQKFCDMLGYPRDELIGKAVKDITHPDDYGSGAQFRSQVTHGKIKEAAGEKRFMCKDGAVIWARRSMSTVLDNAGIPQYIISVVEDITARKQAEEARANLATIVENSSNAIISRTLDGIITSWNAGAERMLGYTASEVIGRPITFTLPPERVVNVGKHNEHILGGALVAPHETQRLTKDGRVLDVLSSISPTKDSAGKITGAAIILQDITAHKQAEAAARESEERFRTTFEQAAVGIAHIALGTFHILMANDKFCRLLGYTQGELISMDSRTLTPAGNVAEREAERAQVMAGKIMTSSRERQLIRKDGSLLWVNRSLSVVRDPAGQPQYLLSVIEDISERKHAERLMTLEHTVTRCLADADSASATLKAVIRTICETQGWECGRYLGVDEQAGVLRFIECWHMPGDAIEQFVASKHEAVFGPGVGLAGRAWQLGQPTWVTDIRDAAGSLKAAVTLETGMDCAFHFPVKSEGKVIGVLAFNSRKVREPDKRLLQAVNVIGSQIGQFLQRKQAEERIHHLANYDELTGLPNRTMFNQHLTHALAQARRNGKQLAVLFIDLDRFKNINDTLGHEAGDRVLKEVADRLRGCMRESDIVGRQGGDEFVVLIEEPPQLAGVNIVAQKILDAVARPLILAAQEYHIGASIGISAYPVDGEDMQTLLKHADAAMYRAKERGRNNYQFYSAQMTAPSSP